MEAMMAKFMVEVVTGRQNMIYYLAAARPQ
jgi:hypothetical protein